MDNGSFYDSDYYENGIESGKSLYSNYCWRKTETTTLMRNLSDHLNIKKGMKILDYGCAKGYLVYSFVQNGIDAYGVDISEYATSKCFDDVANNIRCIKTISDLPKNWGTFDCVIAKDVFEHVNAATLTEILGELAMRTKKIFVVVPLGDGEKYIDPDQELDQSHILKEPLGWWKKMMISTNWIIEEAVTHMPEVKPRYKDKPGSHAFITAVSSLLPQHI